MPKIKKGRINPSQSLKIQKKGFPGYRDMKNPSSQKNWNRKKQKTN